MDKVQQMRRRARQALDGDPDRDNRKKLSFGSFDTKASVEPSVHHIGIGCDPRGLSGATQAKR